MSYVAYLAGAVAIVLLFLFMNRVAIAVMRPEPRPPERTVPDLGVAHEDFVIPSGDHELRAWLLCPGRKHPDEPLVLLAHGWGASYGTVLQLAEPMVEHGHDVLLFDIRGHGRNEALPYVSVRDFRDDVAAVIRYAEGRFRGRRLILVGHSFGGAAGVLALAEGAHVEGLVLIAAPSDVLDVTAEYLTDHGLPGQVMVLFLRPFWWLRLRSSLRPLTPWRRIGEVGVPILMIQPEHDLRVRRHHADRLANAAGLDYHLVRGREHTDVLGAPETLRLIEEFMSSLRARSPDLRG